MNTTQYWRLTGLSTAHIFVVSLILPILAPYFSELGYSEQWISWVFALFPFTMILASLYVGELSDAIGRSWAIRIALLLSALAYGLYWQASTPGIILGRILDAISYTAITILLIAKIQTVLDTPTRAKYTGIFTSCKDFAHIIAPLAGGWLAEKYFGATFLVAILILFILVFFLRNATQHQKKPIDIHPINNLLAFITHKKLRPLTILGPVTNAAIPIITVALPLIILQELEMGYVAIGAATSAFMAGHILQFLIGTLIDKYGTIPFMLLGAASMGSLLFLLPYSIHYYPGLLLLLFGFGVAAAMWNTAALSYIAEEGIKEKKQGAIWGAYVSYAKIGDTVGYLLLGIIVSIGGLGGAFFVFGSILLLGTGISSYLFIQVMRIDEKK